MAMAVRVPKPLITKPLPAELMSSIRTRALSFKVCVAQVGSEQHVLLLFPDVSAAYHIRTVGELDKIIEGLLTIRDQVEMRTGGNGRG